MESFMKKIWNGKPEEAHNQFVRFSRGKFDGRAALFLQNGNKVKLRGSFEWVNDFAIIASELASLNFSGTILSKQELPEIAEFLKKKKEGVIEYEVLEVSSEKIRQVQNRVYCMLLNAEGPEVSLKTKKKLPKPGKSAEAKIDDKFCFLETDQKNWGKIRDAFMLPECKKCRVVHTIIVDSIVLPEGEKDFAKIRELAKRKGKIIRKTEADKKETIDEKEFSA